MSIEAMNLDQLQDLVAEKLTKVEKCGGVGVGFLLKAHNEKCCGGAKTITSYRLRRECPKWWWHDGSRAASTYAEGICPCKGRGWVPENDPMELIRELRKAQATLQIDGPYTMLRDEFRLYNGDKFLVAAMPDNRFFPEEREDNSKSVTVEADDPELALWLAAAQYVESI